MPNWVYNRFTINAPAERCAQIKEELFESSEQPISFGKILPRPPDKEDDWYNWNIATWGTKWDACRAEIVEEADSTLGYGFSTAWSPPMPVLEAFAATHPDIDFDFSYEEEQGWGGVIEVRQGELVKHDTYDAPDSHAEMLERGNECFCSVTEAPFHDCFYEQAKERGLTDPQVLEAVKGLGPDWSDDLDSLIEAARRL